MRKICSYTAMFVSMLTIASSIAVSNAHGQSITLSATALDFGNVELGMQGEDMVTITNSSTNRISVMATVQGGTNGFSTDLDPVFGYAMLPADTLDVRVFFNPNANGDAKDVLVIDVIVFDGLGEIIGNEQDEVVCLDGTGGDSTDPGNLINDILAFYDQSIVDGTLVGTGDYPLRRERAMRCRIKAIGWLIEHGYFCHASYIAHTAIRRTDGEPCPRDFVEGSNLQALNDQLVLLKLLLDS